MENKIQLQCDFCNEAFERTLQKHQYNQLNSRTGGVYCSPKCGSRGTKNKRKAFDIGQWSKDNPDKIYKINKHSGNRRNELSPFRETLRRCTRRKSQVTITLIDLQKQWTKQKGICPYTGIKLILPEKSNDVKNRWELASLDRIDSNKGYIPKNIEFVSMNINYMKSTMSKRDTIKFCKLIAKHYKTK